MNKVMDSDHERILGIIEHNLPAGWSKEDVWQTVLAECNGCYDAARLYLDRLDSDPQLLRMWIGEFAEPNRDVMMFFLGVVSGIIAAILLLGTA